MSGRSIRRLALRLGAVTIAFAVGGGLATGMALADPEPTTTQPPATTAEPAPPSSEPPPTSTVEPAPTTEPTTTDPAPTLTSEPAPTTTTEAAPGSTADAPAGPAQPRIAEEEPPDLRVTAVFDKERYIGSDPVRITLTIANIGSVDAPGVRTQDVGDIVIEHGLDDLRGEQGVDIAAGSTRVFELSGFIAHSGGESIELSISAFSRLGDAQSDDNLSRARARLLAAAGKFGGTIFTDQNANGAIDAGETGLAGVTIRVSGGGAPSGFQLTTDAQGRFSTTLGAGRYFLSYSASPGWIVYGITGRTFDFVTIDNTDNQGDLRIPAVRHLSESLDVGMRFDRTSYQPGDTTTLKVTLSNHGANPLSGVVARCFTTQGAANLRGGEGWGPLDDGGPGLTIPAHKSVVVAVSERVPDAATQFGFVTASCRFGAAGYPADAEAFPPFPTPTARVSGVAGKGRGRLFQDHNSNGLVDNGEALAGLTVVIMDPDTGAEVTRATSDGDGRFIIDGIPVTRYDMRVDGPWKPRFGPGWFQFPVVGGDFIPEYSFDVVPSDQQDNRLPNLKVSATFDEAAYNSGDVVRARITVTNIGGIAAEKVKAQPGQGRPALQVESWDGLEPFGQGVRVDAGATRTFEITGFISDAGAGVVTFTASVGGDNGDTNLENNFFAISASVTETFGNYAGVVYTDRNKDGVRGPGEEGLAGVRISLSSRTGFADHMLTGPDGRFSFDRLPTGRYFAFFSAPDGWVVRFVDNLTIDEAGIENAEIPAIRPLSETMDASLEFLRDAYNVGDTVHIRVRLTNRGPDSVEHIRALCNAFGSDNGLNGDAEGWGPLRFNADGVTVRPGETVTIDVTDTVPAAAANAGFVDAVCAFGPELLDGMPGDVDSATIIGKTATAKGTLIFDKGGDGAFDDPVAGTKVVLLDLKSGRPVAKAVTGADGNFDIPGIPAAIYHVVVVGPWQPVEDESMVMFVRSDGFVPGGGRWEFRLQPGPDQPDPFPDTPGAPVNPAPAPQGSAAPAGGLASTGASVVGLVVVSLGLVGAGAGAVLAGRRRRADRS